MVYIYSRIPDNDIKLLSYLASLALSELFASTVIHLVTWAALISEDKDTTFFWLSMFV